MKIKPGVFSSVLLMFFPLLLHAQISLQVPNDTKNTRFYEDIFNIERPALSIVGFDNGGDNSKGFGLKQILEKLYNGTANPLMVKAFNKIIDLAYEDLKDPFNIAGERPLSVVNRNSNILQSRAFVALARYILFKNGIINNIPDSTQAAPPYQQAITDLKQAFLKPKDWLLANSSHEGDKMKWTRSTEITTSFT